MSLIKCSECGWDISEKAMVCPKCGCPVDISIKAVKDKKHIKIKRIVIPIISVFVILAAVFVIYKLTYKDTSGYYNGMKWGTTYAEVKEKIGDKAICNDEKQSIIIKCENYEKKDIPAIISYDCSGDSLKKVTILLENRDGDLSFEGYIKRFDKLYGKHEDDASNRKTWNAKKSKIQLSLLKGNNMYLKYIDILEDISE